jgi:hypothetical protein
VLSSIQADPGETNDVDFSGDAGGEDCACEASDQSDVDGSQNVSGCEEDLEQSGEGLLCAACLDQERDLVFCSRYRVVAGSYFGNYMER